MSQTFILHKSDPRRADILGNAQRFLTVLPDHQSWEIQIKRHVKARTDKQRKAMFGAAYKALMEFSGLQGEADKLELHRFMCGEFWGWQPDPFGNRKPLRTTTKNERGEPDEISVSDALDFYAFLQRRGAEVGCWVPDPDPFWRESRAA